MQGRHISLQHSRFDGNKPQPEAGVRAGDDSSQRTSAGQRFTQCRGQFQLARGFYPSVKLGTSSASVCSRASEL